MISALGISEYFGGGGEVIPHARMSRPSDVVSSTGSEKCGSACKGIQVLGAIASYIDQSDLRYATVNNSR